MSPDGVGNLASALQDVGALVAAVSADQWAAPTPCANWSVQQLTDHLVGGNLLFAAIVSGEPTPPPEQLRQRPVEDRLGDDAAAAYRRSVQSLVTAFEQPGVLDRVHAFPVGPLPGRAAVQLRTVETLVHGWDLATATGQRLPASADGLAEGVLDFSRQLLTRIPEDRSPFAPPRAAPDDAPALDRLLALLGRDPGASQIGGRSS